NVTGVQTCALPISKNPKWFAAHKRAREIKIAKNCEMCLSTKNLDIHHKDENWQNNSPQNLQVLCRSCHTKVHRKKKQCKVCGKPQKGLGYCNKHYIRYKKYGDPTFTKNSVSE